MRTIALINQKGGVGKTTTAVNLGAALAELGRRVCLIDLDPQAHLTINYGVDPSAQRRGVYDVLLDDCPVDEALHRVSDNISLLPSSIDLAGAEVEMVSIIGRELLLRDRIRGLDNEFDFLLLDCPPSLGLLTVNALAATTEVIIPMQPHFLALQGVGKLLETVALVSRRMNPALKVTGIVLTMFDAQTRLSTEVVDDLEGFIAAARGRPLPWAEARIFHTRIRRNIKLAECPSFGQTIFTYEPSSNGAADYRALAREVLEIALSAGQPAGAATQPSMHALPQAAAEAVSAGPATPEAPPQDDARESHAPRPPQPAALPDAAPAISLPPATQTVPADGAAATSQPHLAPAAAARAVAAASPEAPAGPPAASPSTPAANPAAGDAKPMRVARGRSAATAGRRPGANQAARPPAVERPAAQPAAPAPQRAVEAPVRQTPAASVPAAPAKPVILVAMKSRPAQGAAAGAAPARAAAAYRSGGQPAAAAVSRAGGSAGATGSIMNAR